MKKSTKKIYRHGELTLVEVKKAPTGFKQVKDFILAHSETGHNHVLEAQKAADLEIYEQEGQIFVKINNPVKLVHKKSFDAHRTLEIEPGVYKRFEMTEYNPFLKTINVVKD